MTDNNGPKTSDAIMVNDGGGKEGVPNSIVSIPTG